MLLSLKQKTTNTLATLCIRGSPSTPSLPYPTSHRLLPRRRHPPACQIGVLVGNCDGFVGNRMLKWYTAETEFLLEEGASPAEVDRAVKTFGMGMGPLEMSDVAGNDISYLIKYERCDEGGGIVSAACRSSCLVFFFGASVRRGGGRVVAVGFAEGGCCSWFVSASGLFGEAGSADFETCQRGEELRSLVAGVLW